MTRWMMLLACMALAGCGGRSSDGQTAQGADASFASSANDQVAAATADSPFGAHEPRACPPRKFDGPPTARQAMDLFICDAEKNVGGYVYLVSNVTVQTGKSRPYSVLADGGHSDIDVSAAIYPIQGRFTDFQCNRRDAMLGGDPNNNCLRTDFEPATGACYENTFGEWHCGLQGAGVLTQGYQSPPTGG
jgi:hypothetical protein